MRKEKESNARIDFVVLGSLYALLSISIIQSGCQKTITEESNRESAAADQNLNKEKPSPQQQEPRKDTSQIKPKLPDWNDQTKTIELDRKITETEFSRVCKLPLLETLILDGGGVSTDQVDELLQLKNLEHLRIRNFPAGDPEIEKLIQLKKLRIVNFPQAKFSNDSVKLLSELGNLQLLRFSSPNVSDSGMVHLKNCETLRALHLIRVSVTNESVESLCQIKSLESLYLDGSKINDDGYSKILKLRPDIHLHVDQVHLDYDPNKHEHAK